MTVVFVSLQSKSPVFQSLGGYDGDGGSGGAVDVMVMSILQGKLIRPVSMRLRQFSVIVYRVHVCPVCAHWM